MTAREEYVDGPLSRGPISVDQWALDVNAMLAAAAMSERFVFVPSADAMRNWAAEAADQDARGVPREPMPHENWCPAGVGICDRQEGHPGGHSTKY